jgi:hypothetical protein
MKLIACIVLWLLTLLTLCGCAGHPTPEPKATSIVLSRNIGDGVGAWEQEAAKRLTNPVVVVCHGTTLNGRWAMTPDNGPPMEVQGVALLLKQLYGPRPIVFVTCNEGNHDITVKGVYYAHGIIWNWPHTPKPGVSTISQFIEGR